MAFDPDPAVVVLDSLVVVIVLVVALDADEGEGSGGVDGHDQLDLVAGPQIREPEAGRDGDEHLAPVLDREPQLVAVDAEEDALELQRAGVAERLDDAGLEPVSGQPHAHFDAVARPRPTVREEAARRRPNAEDGAARRDQQPVQAALVPDDDAAEGRTGDAAGGVQ